MMKKRIGALALACAMAAAIPVMSVNAQWKTSTLWNSASDVTNRNTIYSEAPYYNADGSKNGNESAYQKKLTDYITDSRSAGYNAAELKPSGIADVKVSVVSGDAKDSILDNGVKTAVKEFVKRETGAKTDGTRARAIAAIYYGTVNASQAGDVTFKLEDKVDDQAKDGDRYAIVLHYTGNAADEDGITAQYSKISAAGKLTAHFNSFGPFAIIVTTEDSAQQLANTYSHSVGSDAANLTPATTTVAPVATTPAVAAPVSSTATAAPVSSTATAAAPVATTTTAAPAATTTTAAPAAATQATTAVTSSTGVQTTTPNTFSSANQPIMVVR